MNDREHNNMMNRNGSALILVVVVTVLLAVIGVMFVMVSRLEGVLSVSVLQERELDEAVEMTTARIERLLTEDLFGDDLQAGLADGTGASNEPYDIPGPHDLWLASLEPVKMADPNDDPADSVDDLFQWPVISNITDLSDTDFHTELKPNWDCFLREAGPVYSPPMRKAAIQEYPDASEVEPFLPADADGDGILDSVWVEMDGSTCRGHKVYAAVRIIDNCAMLNLNTACYTTNGVTYFPWINFAQYRKDIGRYLSELNYEPFLRGDDAIVNSGQSLQWRNPNRLWRSRMKNKFIPFLPTNWFEAYHNDVIMHIGDPNHVFTDYEPFGIPDELELRNRFLLTSLTQSRLERTDRSASPARYGLYQTFDYNRGQFVPFQKGVNDDQWKVLAHRIPYDDDNFYLWKARLNPDYFSLPSYDVPQEDRRHLCTVYSFDRPLPLGRYDNLSSLSASIRSKLIPEKNMQVCLRSSLIENTPEARRRILQLLFAFQSYFYDQKGDTRQVAAQKACQIVANVIDYLDDPNTLTEGPFYDLPPAGPFTAPRQYSPDPTVINLSVIRSLVYEQTGQLAPAFSFGINSGDVFYGYERQPFITELYTSIDNDSGGVQSVGIELLNPYDDPIDLTGWRIHLTPRIGAEVNYNFGTEITTVQIPAASARPGRLVIYYTRNGASDPVNVTPGSEAVQETVLSFGTTLLNANSIDLQRPDPVNSGSFITVDRILQSRLNLVLTDASGGGPTRHVLRRSDTGWKFANPKTFFYSQLTGPYDTRATLGTDNGITSGLKGCQLQVADDKGSFDRLADFQKVIAAGNMGSLDPNSLTEKIGYAPKESDIRFTLAEDPNLLEYITFLQRPDGILPGRININTAPAQVINAAIPPLMAGSLKDEITVYRKTQPITRIADLLNTTDFPSIDTYAKLGGIPGDSTIAGDLEEQDWIINRLSNILTTRSDVFTAYILVRIGQNGPQRRVIAIFDRSNVWTNSDKPRLVALHPVPDPR